MYKAHSKDINRNKSFNPLNGRNLQRVEEVRAELAVQEEAGEQRRKELLRDQEERRYDALGEEIGNVSLFKPVRNIFAEEYEKDAKRELVKEEPHSGTNNNTSSTTASTGLRSRFRKEVSATEEAKREPVKRERDATTTEDPPLKAKKEETETTIMTGSISSSDAAKLKRDLELVKKQRLDPLRKVQQYENSTVAHAARQAQQNTTTTTTTSSTTTTDKKGGSALQDSIRELLELKRRNKK